MVCPSCGNAVREGAKFCNQCGTPLALACPSCGEPYQPDQRFCEECGAQLPGTVSGPAPPTPAVMHEPAPTGPEMRMVSVLFVDLVGFTSLSEKREAEDVRELLGRYFDSTRTIIERHGGVVEKFIGDAVMAVWGVPVAREDDAERAVRTALEVVDAVSAFGQEVGAPDLRARAGVVTGQVAALESPGEGLVVGDRVNTASRVQSAAEPGSVLVDEVTRQVTSAAIVYADAGEHSVKGKAEPLRLWRAVRVLGGVGGSDREQGLEAGFVGRDADLRLLKELFHSALDRRSARLLAVSGEAGVGKSRLRREFFNYIDGLSSTVLWHLGRCLSHGEGVAYWALAEMVRQRLGIAEDASEGEARERLEKGLERWVPDPADRTFILPRLGALLGVAEPGLGREELFAGWRLFFERLADHEPVALVFEDIQWADAGLLDFIEQLLDWSSSSPIFILTLARPELASGREGWPAGRRGATLIQLEPLDDDSMRALLSDLVGDLPEAAAGQIVARAQGVPLYAVETVRALADRGAFSEREGRLVLEGELGELDVPASLSSLISARLDALDAQERTLVKAMSVFGGSFPSSAAAALSGLDESDLDRALASLLQKGVLVIRTDRLSPDRGQYAFAQSLLRTVAYEMLSRQERKPRHLAAAQYLRTVFPNDGEEVAEVVANHYLDAYRASSGDADEAELRNRTVDALSRAGRRATTVAALETAERVYRTAASLVDDEAERAGLLKAAGVAASTSGRFEVSHELLEEAYQTFLKLDMRREAARVVPQISLVLSRMARPAESAERAQAGLDLLDGDGLDADAAELHIVIARSMSLAGRQREALEHAERAIETAQALKLTKLFVDALSLKASLHLYTGRVEEARLDYANAQELAERNDFVELLPSVIGNYANLCLMWDIPDGANLGQTALELSRRLGDRYGESVDGANFMAALLLLGRWQEVSELAPQLLRDDRAPHVQSRMCWLNLLRGDLVAARAALSQLEEWVESGVEMKGMRTAAIAAMAVVEGRSDEALALGKEMLPDTIETLGPASEPIRDGWPVTLQAALALGRLEEARDLLELLGSRPPGHIPPYLEAHLARGRALTSALAGEHDAVEAGLQSAIDGFRRLGYPYWLAVTQTDLAEWLIGQDRGEEAEALLAEALPALSELGARPALERASQLVGSDRPSVRAKV